MFFISGLVSSSLLYFLIVALISNFGFSIPMPYLGVGVIYFIVKSIQNVIGAIWLRKRGVKREPFLLSYITGFIWDMTNPFRGLAALRLLKGTTRADLRVPWKVYNRFEVILHFLWSVALWLVLLIALTGLFLL